jgi:hypothetical protein
MSVLFTLDLLIALKKCFDAPRPAPPPQPYEKAREENEQGDQNGVRPSRDEPRCWRGDLEPGDSQPFAAELGKARSPVQIIHGIQEKGTVGCPLLGVEELGGGEGGRAHHYDAGVFH